MYFLSIYFENLHSLGYKCGKSVLDDISVENALKTNRVADSNWGAEAGGSTCQARLIILPSKPGLQKTFSQPQKCNKEKF